MMGGKETKQKERNEMFNFSFLEKYVLKERSINLWMI